MHLWRPCLVFLFAAFAADGAVIYKWTDADGVVHYSDQPVPGAEKIVTSSPTTNGIGGAVPASTPSQSPAKSAAVTYTQFSIESPTKEQVFFNDEIIPIRLMLEPALRPNQTISWHLNGKELDDQPPTAVSFTLQSLVRGTYILAATITDSVTGESKTSDSVTFYMRQPSALDNQHRTH
jgi:Domain of unknown function (DUF4124)